MKGVLRFWWRALAWGIYEPLARRRGNTPLALLHEAEAWLFGSASNGVSRVRIRVNLDDHDPSDPPFPDGAKPYPYLGYGLNADKGTTTDVPKPARVACAVRVFAVHLFYDDRLPPENHLFREIALEALELLPQAVRALGLLGGVGARTRRGFGSLCLTSMRISEGRRQSGSDTPDVEVQTLDEYEASLKELLRRAFKGEVPAPPYSAFSPSASVTICIAHESASMVLHEAGFVMQHYRSYGGRGPGSTPPHRLMIPEALQHEKTRLIPVGEGAGDETWERSFVDDHDDFYLGKNTKVPRRTAFGLPHNYGAKKYVAARIGGELKARRASPLHFHVHKLKTKTDKPYYVLVLTVLMPAEDSYLPPGAELVWRSTTAKAPNGWEKLPGAVDLGVIEQFVARFNHVTEDGYSIARLDAGIPMPQVERQLEQSLPRKVNP